MKLQKISRNKLSSSIKKAIGISALGIQLAQANSGIIITVNSTADQSEVGLVTFREAVIQSNAASGARITFDEDVFSTPQTIILEQGEISVNSNILIDGPGADLLTINGAGLSRILKIDDETDTSENVTISNITFTGGNGVSDNAPQLENNRGGCIFTKEPLTLNRTVITACESSVDGGGLGSLNTELIINDSIISHNTTAFKGGGIKSQGGQLRINNSTISHNRANRSVYAGGGIETSRTPLIITNSTISENEARAGATGGISIYQLSDLTMLNTTVVNNTGGGVNIRRASLVDIKNSIIASNTDGDCDFTLIDEKSINQSNLDTDGSCDVLAINHITVADPMLEPLANFGGATPTHLPLPGSPVIDAGDDQFCQPIDQRGNIRPQDGNNDVIRVCDIGAVELGDITDLIF